MKITQNDKLKLMRRSKMICEKCREAKLPQDGDLSDLIHLDVPRSEGGGKRTHREKSDWYKSLMGDELGNLILICKDCKHDLKVKKISVRMPLEKVQRIDDWRKKMLPNETLSDVFRIAVERLIDETSAAAMKIQMAETKGVWMNKKIQLIEQIIHLPLDDVKRVDMLMPDREGKTIAIEMKDSYRKEERRR